MYFRAHRRDPDSDRDYHRRDAHTTTQARRPCYYRRDPASGARTHLTSQSNIPIMIGTALAHTPSRHPREGGEPDHLHLDIVQDYRQKGVTTQSLQLDYNIIFLNDFFSPGGAIECSHG